MYVYDYFSDLIKKDYLELMDYTEKDLFIRLRQSYLLQIKLSEKYPWVFEFHKLSHITNSIEVNRELECRTRIEHSNCCSELFDEIDRTKFRKVLDIEKCKRFIYWSDIGFTAQLLEGIRSTKNSAFGQDTIIKNLMDILMN